jgi:hypothetical protein
MALLPIHPNIHHPPNGKVRKAVFAKPLAKAKLFKNG